MRKEEGGGGKKVWNPKVCVPKIARINISFCNFHFFPQGNLDPGGGSEGGVPPLLLSWSVVLKQACLGWGGVGWGWGEVERGTGWLISTASLTHWGVFSGDVPPGCKRPIRGGAVFYLLAVHRVLGCFCADGSPPSQACP